MADRWTDPTTQDLHRGLFITAAILALVSAVLGMAGAAMAGIAVVSTGRRWSRRVEMSPGDLAKLKWSQAKAAAGAVPAAWRDAENVNGSRSASVSRK